MRIATERELQVLRHFVGPKIEPPYAFPGVGPKTFAAMVAEGWIEWASSPETFVYGYRITEKGKTAANPE